MEFTQAHEKIPVIILSTRRGTADYNQSYMSE